MIGSPGGRSGEVICRELGKLIGGKAGGKVGEKIGSILGSVIHK